MKSELRQVEQFLLSLNATWKNLGLYSSTHPAPAAAFEKLGDAFQKFLGGEEQITLGLLHDTLVLDGTPLIAKPDLSRNLVTRLQNGEIQGVIFLKGYTLEELRHFVELLGQDVKGGEFEQELKKRGVSHIRLAQLVQEGPGEDRRVEVVDRGGARAIYSRALQTIRRVFQEARLGKMPSLSEVRRTV